MEEEEEEVFQPEEEKVAYPPEKQIPADLFTQENVDGFLDSGIGIFIALSAIKNMNIGIPSICTVRDILFIVDNIEVEKDFTEESFVNYFGLCLAALQNEFLPPSMEEDEDDEAFILTKEFIQDRLSDLQPVDGSDFNFTFTSFCVQTGDIADITPLLEFNLLTSIELKNNLLKDISPLGQMPRLKNLNVAENKLLCVKDLNFPVLENLNLSKNQIGFIESLQAPKLKKLNLSENKIFFISPFAFSDCKNLEVLDLSTNSIRDIKEGTFNGLTNLKQIKLNINSLLNVAYAFSFDLTGVVDVDLSENPLPTIQGIESLVSLEVCDLHKTQIESPPDLSPMFDLACMKYLYIYETPLAEIEDVRLEVIHSIPTLEEIDEQTVTINERQDADTMFAERAAEEQRQMMERLEADEGAEEEEEVHAETEPIYDEAEGEETDQSAQTA